MLWLFGTAIKEIWHFLFHIFACNKEKSLPPTNGIYRGVFSRILADGDTSGTGVVFLALDDHDSSFTLSGDTTSNAPFSCYGAYSLLGDNQISFTTTSPLDPEMSDINYVLDTIYEYEFLDTNFYLQMYKSEASFFGADQVTTYDYNLTRY